MWTALSTISHVRLTDATVSQEVVVSYLPLSHIAAQMVDMWITMRVGGLTHFAQPDALKVRSEGKPSRTHGPTQSSRSSGGADGTNTPGFVLHSLRAPW